MSEELTKLTVNLIPAAVLALDQATQIEEDSRTDTVNRALQIYAFLVQKTHIEGRTIILRGEYDEETVVLS